MEMEGIINQMSDSGEAHQNLFVIDRFDKNSTLGSSKGYLIRIRIE